MKPRRRRPLLELDPDLGRLVDAARLERAERELDVELHALDAGPWEVGGHEAASAGHVGLLIIEGVVSREVIFADTVSTELLGPGDVVRPWSLKPGGDLLRLGVRWTCLADSRVALLDNRFAALLTRWPEVNAVLIDRLNDRSQRLATTQAISQLTRVDRRLLAVFWHLAERWGRVTSSGVCVPLTLSHRMLGQLVGARRQTVSAALGDLARNGELLRREDHTWMLKGDPIGASTEAAQRIVPMRRALVPAAPAPDGRPEPPRRVSGPSELELREAFAKVQRESHRQIAHARELSDESRRLNRITLIARREREAARHARRPRRPWVA